MTTVVAFQRQTKFSFEPFETIRPRSQPDLVKGVLPVGGVAFIVGASKAGKSFLAIDTSLRIAAGARTVLGRKAKSGGVVYFAAEDANGCRARVMAWREKYRRQSAPIPFDLVGQPINLLDEGEAHDLRASLLERRERLESAGGRLALIVFDTLSRCLPGVDENNSVDMSRAFAVLTDLAEVTGALVLVLAHFGKAGAERGIRGWSGLDANSDATITLERDPADDELRTLTFAKVKNGVDGGRLSFRLESASLGMVDEDGDEMTSCVLAFEKAPDGTAKAKKRRSLNAPEQVVLAAVRHVTDNGRTQSPPPSAVGVKPWQNAVTRADVRARALTSGLAAEGEKPNTVNTRFGRALEGLAAYGSIRMEGESVWLS